MVAEIFHFQTSAMGRVGCAGYVVGLRRLCGGWVGNYSDNNATLWPHLASWVLLDFQLSWDLKIGPSVAIIPSLWPWPYVCLQYIWSRVGESWVLRNINFTNKPYFLNIWWLGYSPFTILRSAFNRSHHCIRQYLTLVWSLKHSFQIWERSSKWLLRYSVFKLLRWGGCRGYMVGGCRE